MVLGAPCFVFRGRAVGPYLECQRPSPTSEARRAARQDDGRDWQLIIFNLLPLASNRHSSRYLGSLCLFFFDTPSPPLILEDNFAITTNNYIQTAYTVGDVSRITPANYIRTVLHSFRYSKLIRFASGGYTQNWALGPCFISFFSTTFVVLGFGHKVWRPISLVCPPGRDFILYLKFQSKIQVFTLLSFS